ncbi:MAG: 2-C-methyl-D-erythritol 4-phosphate cytidylyltransferase [Gammaproteobacteria bacterium]|nr:2-C-methyl-D-erythritol 4-phosphate cytidylyltransferase [Gammaproteobacteria bacterium]
MPVVAERYWGLVPAAGVGTRMGGGVPKQYLELAGRPLMTYALEALLSHPRMAGVMVVVGAADTRWPALGVAGGPSLMSAIGGAERCHSVINGLHALAAAGAAGGDWVLVHDAARPCLREADITRLMDELSGHPVGGLLGLPVRDTMKRAGADGQLRETVSREGLWHALTPQMFRLGPLQAALETVVAAGATVTDEAEAMELAGHTPRLVEGSPDNIKVTHPADLRLAALYLAGQQRDRT